MIQSCSPVKKKTDLISLKTQQSVIIVSIFILKIKYQDLVQIKVTRFINCIQNLLFIPFSVRGVKVGVWSQTSGAGTPHSVQRRLQVTAPPQHGSRERHKEEKGIEMEATCTRTEDMSRGVGRKRL